MEQAQRKGEFSAGSREYKYGTIPQLEQQLKELEAKVADKEGRRLLQEEVTPDEHHRRSFPARTGIPVSRLLEGEKDKATSSQ